MTGRIDILATDDRPGRITTRTGVNRFHYAYELPPGGTEGLSVGGLVTFELKKGDDQMAVGVCPKDEAKASAGAESRLEVRYQGFEQTNNVRAFKFQAWRTGQENQEAVVTVDLALLRKYGITIQEGPALCLRLLEAELQQPTPNDPQALKRGLTDKEMMAHVACRPGKKR
ncbi:MAG: hypothetical protein EHM23_14110 [Acidobacteria bacterium]|nr:MAG: hypothetical protein EHM23_14110 [Acidobacteriota bacterium]